jgi:HTH-type transcriptional regulator, cell division transcriptional repressor
MDRLLFGERLRDAREAAGMSQQQIASRLGVKAATVNHWETGKKEPRANRLQMLASLLNVPLLWLLAGSQQVPDPSSELDSAQLMRQKLAEVNGKMTDLRNCLDELALLIENNS